MKLSKKFLFPFLLSFLTLSQLTAGITYDYIVAADGSGDVTTLQAAIDLCRAYRSETKHIFIKNGVYHEKVLIPSYLAHIHLVGENRDSTVITWDDHVGKGTIGTFQSYTLKVSGNEVTIENLTIENASGRVGQAVALHAEGDCVKVINCNLLGNQDTLYATGRLSRQYYANCHIEGTTDFIFGSATALFEKCTIHSKENSFITAASTPDSLDFGYVFMDCKLTADEGVDRVYLGRPWRDFARVVYLRCEMGDHIVAEGWNNWSRPEREQTTFYAEYACTGPAASREGRVAWSHELKKKEARKYTLENIFNLNTTWEP